MQPCKDGLCGRCYSCRTYNIHPTKTSIRKIKLKDKEMVIVHKALSDMIFTLSSSHVDLDIDTSITLREIKEWFEEKYDKYLFPLKGLDESNG